MMKKIFAVVPGLVGALLPNATCPACWPLYAGVLSSLGLGFLMQGTYFYIVIGILLSISLGALFYKAKQRHGYGPLWLGLLAAIIIMVSKYLQLSSMYMYGGAAILIIASVWNNWFFGRRKNGGRLEVVPCPSCQDSKTHEIKE